MLVISHGVGQAYLAGLAGLEHVTGHLRLGVVGLAPQQVGEVGEVVAVVDEARDELRSVLEYEDRRVVAARGDTSDDGAAEDQLNFSRLRHGAAVALLALPADLRHQPRQHGQGGAPVQGAPADVGQREPPIQRLGAALLLGSTRHVEFRAGLCGTT